MSFADAFANINKPKNERFDKNHKKTNQPLKQQNELPKDNKPKPFKANIGWLFYKDYFNGINFKNLNSDESKEIINKKVLNIINQGFFKQQAKNLGNSFFELSTIYPGLLIGSGNTHELPEVKGQAILGFHFDYTSGLPEISGSSIKGVLRSAFAHKEYIKEILDDSTLDIEKLEYDIFDNKDIFFDAIIIKSGKNNKILGDDFITPHKEEIKNPIPLRFIKVIPEVTFSFEFLLEDGLIKKEKKLALFKQIILDFGLGAKTNVGYGKFQEIEAKS
ncbi:type III-B CRISPR module RAMP protein Cmr6 [Aliarcobacter butzleri]|uniref:CRISPR type III-associated protein domain-containing protein n=1 Tax=Aliarcobacter butzleri L348 TaxID=1447256 RepID=A0A0G9K6N8_9BACT|nr:type III-B CRISPR module RAMP protein Cmr6 [Aliarcobacter butzleri]KLE02184.1 hypothetical protein AA20_01375 [Aliarcobacter butzleri L348]